MSQLASASLPTSATPSLTQMAELASGSERASSRFSTARRSTGQGLGSSDCTAARASAARTGANAGGASSPARGAVVASTTCRSSRPASARRPVSAACRTGQSRAAAQPSSTMKRIGPVAARRCCGFISGWASARMTRAASAMRNRISHSGVRAGVSSRGTRPSSSRIAGKAMRRGAGGVTRKSHQMIGNAVNARSSHGEAKARDPSASIAQPIPGLDPRSRGSPSNRRGGSFETATLRLPQDEIVS